MNSQKKQTDLGTDFKDKMKSWFQSKGILNRLELFLKNQMILEFQRTCGQSLHPQNANLSPKMQAIKVLVADFLLQEDLLFSLSVYCTEVPYLLNLNRYNQYVSCLANSKTDLIRVKKASKPKFNEKELLDVLQAMNLNLKMEEFNAFYNIYKSGKTSSLLESLLGTIPKLIRKHRTIEYQLKKARKKQKLLRKLATVQKTKMKSMYDIVLRAYGVVEKHKSDMKELLRNQNDKQSGELTKKENELATWQKMLKLKEDSLEKSHRNRMEEIENRMRTLNQRELELQSKYQMLQQEIDALKIERERAKRAELQLETAYVGEADELREFQQKFCSLQAEVQDMLGSYNEKRQPRNFSETNTADSKDFRECIAEDEILSSMEEYMNLVEKENSLLKLSSNEQRSQICQLSNEVAFLKNRLSYLEKEMHIRKHIELEFQRKEFMHAVLLPGKHRRSQSRTEHEDIHESVASQPSSRRKLFRELEIVQPSELSSNGTSRETNLTEEIVADAKNKVKELENESEVLNRNFKSLQHILTRNIALSESKNFATSSLAGSSSPRLSHFSKSFSDLDSPRMSANVSAYAVSHSWENAAELEANPEGEVSSPRIPRFSLPARRSSSFRELFIKRKKWKTRSKNSRNLVAESECSSIASSPKEKINDDVEVQVLPVSKQPSNSEESSVVVHQETDDSPIEKLS